MSKKIILNLAISIDGYIASEDGGFEWIVGDGDKSLDTEKKWDFNGFLDTIDVVVMGKIVMIKTFIKILKIKKYMLQHLKT